MNVLRVMDSDKARLMELYLKHGTREFNGALLYDGGCYIDWVYPLHAPAEKIHKVKLTQRALELIKGTTNEK